MKNLIVDGESYPRIFIYNNNYFLKYSINTTKAWKILQRKNIDFINNPAKIYKLNNEEKEKYPIYKSKILLPILKGYKTFYEEEYTQKLTTIELIKLFKKNLILLKNMHQKGVIHSDLFEKNIMLNSEFDIKFIDLDASIIDDYISVENVYFYDKNTDVIKEGIQDDKLDTLNMYLSYLEKGSFKNECHDIINFKSLSLPLEIKKELLSYSIKDRIIEKDYYFEDIIEELLRIDYEAPKIKERLKTRRK